MRPGGYNGDYPATGQKQTGRATFSNSDIELSATECFGYKRFRRLYDKSLGKKRPLEPVKHYELGVSLAQEVPKSLQARR